jgi:ATP-dependent RNA helicase DDX23/PRP28
MLTPVHHGVQSDRGRDRGREDRRYNTDRRDDRREPSSSSHRDRDRDRASERDDDRWRRERHDERSHRRDDNRRGAEIRSGSHNHDSHRRDGPSTSTAETSEGKRSRLDDRRSDPAAAMPPPPSPPPKEKVEPQSLEELLLKKKAAEEEQSRPKFLTKQQRTELALKKREAEGAAIRAKREEQVQLRKKLDTQARNSGSSGGGYSRYHAPPPPPRERRESTASVAAAVAGDPGGKTRSEREAELKAIKDRYLGGVKKKRKVVHLTCLSALPLLPARSLPAHPWPYQVASAAKYLTHNGAHSTLTSLPRIVSILPQIRKMNEKKFVFDWDCAEDTSSDYNPIYSSKHQAQLFGRGHVGGIDVASQKKDNSRFYEDLLEKRRTADEKDQEERRLEKVRVKEKRVMHDDRHWSAKPLPDMTERDWRIFKEDFSISVRGGFIPDPLRNWGDAHLKPEIMEIIRECGFTDPTPVQRAAIPIGLQNRDVVGIAQTGSGKTLAFVIPLVTWITSLPKIRREEDMDNGPYGVILAPTRELVQQIEEEALRFAKPLGIRLVSVIGGASREEQGFQLRLGVEIVVATPGRLVDVLENRYLVLNQCTYIVMDEADRMLDLNFETDLKAILEYLPVTNTKPDDETAESPEALLANMKTGMKFRQTVLFSATMPAAVQRIANLYLRRPALVTIGTAGHAADSVEQRVYLCTDQQKRNKLMDFLKTNPDPPIIIFANSKKGCDALAKSLEKMGYKAVTLHGSKSQEQREASLAALKSGAKDILVATDVAGRGIDIKDVSHVVNYDMAKTVEQYTHRIGRTGRAGKTGIAITFLTEARTIVHVV